MNITHYALKRENGYIGINNFPTFITIHETSTGLEKEPAYKDKNRYIRMLENPISSSPNYGYHFLCSDKEVIQFFPTNVQLAHTGNIDGNLSSIGIERLVNVNIDFDIAIHIQAKLTASLMNMHNIPINNVVPHRYWSKKDCPSRLLAGLYGWDWPKFIETVQQYYKREDFFINIV